MRVPARRAVFGVCALAWMGVIFYLSSLSGTGMPGQLSPLAHFGAYAVLGALLLLALDRGVVMPRTMVAAVLIASAYGVTDEFHQSFVPKRTPDPADWLVDTLGAIVAVLVVAWLLRRTRRQLPPQ